MDITTKQLNDLKLLESKDVMEDDWHALCINIILRAIQDYGFYGYAGNTNKEYKLYKDALYWIFVDTENLEYYTNILGTSVGIIRRSAKQFRNMVITGEIKKDDSERIVQGQLDLFSLL